MQFNNQNKSIIKLLFGMQLQNNINKCIQLFQQKYNVFKQINQNYNQNLQKISQNISEYKQNYENLQNNKILLINLKKLNHKNTTLSSNDAKYIPQNRINYFKYKCNYKSRDSITKHQSSYYRHKRINTGYKPYLCEWPKCLLRFTTLYDLKG